MTTSTIYSDAADGFVYVTGHPTYATARAGSSLIARTADIRSSNGNYFAPGQRLFAGDYICTELFLWFATATIPDGDTVTTATLSLYGDNDQSATDFTITAALHNWGDTLTTADWVAGADLGGKTTVATFATSGFSTSGYNDFTDVAFPANVDKAANTRLILYSSRHSAGDEPTGHEAVSVFLANETGTTYDPKLVITHAAAASGWSSVSAVFG